MLDNTSIIEPGPLPRTRILALLPGRRSKISPSIMRLAFIEPTPKLDVTRKCFREVGDPRWCRYLDCHGECRSLLLRPDSVVRRNLHHLRAGTEHRALHATSATVRHAARG